MCKFCESYESQRRIDKFWNHHTEPDDEKLYHEYTVAFVTHTWTKTKGKRNAGRTTDYRYRGLGYKLNYCPECGKKLNCAQSN